MKFTDKTIKGLKPRTSAYRIFEKGVDKGFGLKVTPKGSISFFIQYSSSGKQSFFNLGRYPSVSIAEAREHCRKIRQGLYKGIEPRQDEQYNSFGTVQDLFDYYIKSMKEHGKKSSEKVSKNLKFNCDSIISKQAKDVTPQDIRKILHEIINRGSPVQANRIRSYLHRAFTVGIHHDNDPNNLSSSITFNLTSNPVDLVPKNSSVERVSDRNLSFEEIQILWNSQELSKSHLVATKLILFYGARMWEIMGAKIDEIDFDKNLFSIPPDRVKNNRWHLLPITNLSKQLFEEANSYSRDSSYLFPSRFDDEKPVGKTSLAHAIKRITKIEKFTPKDLRTTAKSRMGELGIDKTIRDRIQNHALTDVSSLHYDKYDYIEEKRQGLLAWESKLIEFM